MKQTRRDTRIGTVRIHSVHAGSGDPVVLLHGLSGSHNWWRYTIPALAQDYEVHVPELVGFGRSRGDRSQPDIETMSSLMAEWLETIGVQNPHMVGHSMGGQTAIHMVVGGVHARTLTLASASGLPRDVGV